MPREGDTNVGRGFLFTQPVIRGFSALLKDFVRSRSKWLTGQHGCGRKIRDEQIWGVFAQRNFGKVTEL